MYCFVRASLATRMSPCLWSWPEHMRSSRCSNRPQRFAAPSQSSLKKWLLKFDIQHCFWDSTLCPLVLRQLQYPLGLRYNLDSNVLRMWLAKIFKKNSDVLFSLKAFNGRVVLEWLCAEINQFCQTDGCYEFDPRVYHICAAANLVGKCSARMHACMHIFKICFACQLVFWDRSKIKDLKLQLTMTHKFQ